MYFLKIIKFMMKNMMYVNKILLIEGEINISYIFIGVGVFILLLLFIIVI